MMLRKSSLVFSLVFLLASCGRQMAESDHFIDSVHHEMVLGNFDKIYNEMIDESIKSDEEQNAFDQVFTIIGEAKIKKAEKALGYSIDIKNGTTRVESNYTLLGEIYDVEETIIVLNTNGSYKIIGLNVKQKAHP